MSSVNVLPPEAILRLAKFLGMLGSEHMGERASAGLKATQLLQAHGATWADLVQQLNSPAPRHAPPPRQGKPLFNWKPIAQGCLDVHEQDDIVGPCLSAWEHNFITDILERNFDSLTDKQADVLHRVAAKMGVVSNR